jgi:hypothetical protein
MLLWGGGHTDYSGNEIYKWSIDSAKWFLEKQPSSIVTYTGTSSYYDSPADSNQPRSQHSKGRMAACQDSAKMYAIGQLDMYSDINASILITNYSTKTKRWQKVDTLPFDAGNSSNYTAGAYPISSYDSVTKRIFYHGMNDGHAWLFSINCTTSVVSSHGGYWTDDFTDTAKATTGVVDVKRRRFYDFGQNRARYWALTSPGVSSAHVTITPKGPSRPWGVSSPSPGADYSYIDTSIISWAGGDTVYKYNSVNDSFMAVPPSASNTVHPPASQQTNGTFGRWRYSKAHNFFIYVHSADSSVYYYRLSADPDAGSSTSGSRKRGFARRGR